MSAWHSVHRHWQPQGPTSRLLCVNISSFCVRPYCYRRLRAPRMMAVRGVCRPDALSVRTRPTGISCPPSSGLKFSALRQQPRHLRPSGPSSAPTRAIACPIATVCACPNVETVGFHVNCLVFCSLDYQKKTAAVQSNLCLDVIKDAQNPEPSCPGTSWSSSSPPSTYATGLIFEFDNDNPPVFTSNLPPPPSPPAP